MNSGSSTVKFRVYDCGKALGELAGGIVERIVRKSRTSTTGARGAG